MEEKHYCATCGSILGELLGMPHCIRCFKKNTEQNVYQGNRALDHVRDFRITNEDGTTL